MPATASYRSDQVPVPLSKYTTRILTGAAPSSGVPPKKPVHDVKEHGVLAGLGLEGTGETAVGLVFGANPPAPATGTVRIVLNEEPTVIARPDADADIVERLRIGSLGEAVRITLVRPLFGESCGDAEGALFRVAVRAEAVIGKSVVVGGIEAVAQRAPCAGCRGGIFPGRHNGRRTGRLRCSADLRPGWRVA